MRQTESEVGEWNYYVKSNPLSIWKSRLNNNI